MQPLDKKKEKSFLTFKETCDYLSLSPNTLYQYTHKRVLKFYRLRGRKLYFKCEDLDNFLFNEQNLVKPIQQIESEADKKISSKDKGGHHE